MARKALIYGLRIATLVAPALAIAAITISVPAWGQDAAKSAIAQALFDDARALITKGSYAAACLKLEESQRLDPGSGTLLHLADCYEHQGRIASAWSMFLEACSASRATGNADRTRYSRQRAVALETRLSRIAIRILADKTAGLEVRRNGEIVPPAQWETAIPTDPGAYIFTATAKGRANWQTTVTLREGATETVVVPELMLAAQPHGPPERDSVQAKPATPSASGALDRIRVDDIDKLESTGPVLGPQRVAGLVSGGVGIAATAVGAVFGWQAISLHNDSQAPGVCTGGACLSRAGIDLQERSARAGDVATVACAIGALGVAAGAVLWFTAPRGTSVGVGLGTVNVGGGW